MKKGKNLEFNGLGFPVILVDPPFAHSDEGDVLDINYERLQRTAFEALIRKPASLSGAEVRFIRMFMEQSQNVFADLFGVDRSCVGKWESKDLEWTGMGVPAEMLLRTKMVQHLHKSVDDEMVFFEPGARKKVVGEPIELAAQG